MARPTLCRRGTCDGICGVVDRVKGGSRIWFERAASVRAAHPSRHLPSLSTAAARSARGAVRDRAGAPAGNLVGERQRDVEEARLADSLESAGDFVLSDTGPPARKAKPASPASTYSPSLGGDEFLPSFGGGGGADGLLLAGLAGVFAAGAGGGGAGFAGGSGALAQKSDCKLRPPSSVRRAPPYT